MGLCSLIVLRKLMTSSFAHWGIWNSDVIFAGGDVFQSSMETPGDVLGYTGVPSSNSRNVALDKGT